MSDTMLFGVLGMPYEMAMSDELSRRQFYDRVQEAVARLKADDVTPNTLPATGGVSDAWKSLNMDITSKLYEEWLDQPVDTDMTGAPILRRHTYPYLYQDFSGAIPFAAGYAAAQSRQPSAQGGEAEPALGIKEGETVEQAAEGWAQWCEARGNNMLAGFLRKLATNAPKAGSLVGDAETYLRGRYGAYRGHFAWRELEEAFNAGLAAKAAPVEGVSEHIPDAGKMIDHVPEVTKMIAAAPPTVVNGEAKPLQARVAPWMQACFGPEISADRMERNHRFFEESTELVQANGMTRSEAHQLVDYTFDRPLGEPNQEAGGVMITLAALCLASGLDMHEAGETELVRIWGKVDAIRAKQAAKPKHSPLPAAPLPPGRGMVPMTTAQIELAVRNAQIAFCLDKFQTFDEALVRKVEAHHGIKESS